MPGCFFGIFGHELFQLGFGVFVLSERRVGAPEGAGNFAQEFEEVMSTTRIASMRRLGGSLRKRRGGSPDSTQRPELFLGREQQMLVERIRPGRYVRPTCRRR